MLKGATDACGAPAPPAQPPPRAAGADELFGALARRSAVVMFHSDACPLCSAFQGDFARLAERFEQKVREKTPRRGAAPW